MRDASEIWSPFVREGKQLHEGDITSGNTTLTFSTIEFQREILKQAALKLSEVQIHCDVVAVKSE